MYFDNMKVIGGGLYYPIIWKHWDFDKQTDGRVVIGWYSFTFEILHQLFTESINAGPSAIRNSIRQLNLYKWSAKNKMSAQNRLNLVGFFIFWILLKYSIEAVVCVGSWWEKIDMEELFWTSVYVCVCECVCVCVCACVCVRVCVCECACVWFFHPHFPYPPLFYTHRPHTHMEINEGG